MCILGDSEKKGFKNIYSGLLEVLGTAIKTFMRIKDQFQNNFWDGIPLDNRVSSHLRKLNQITSQLCHEGQPLDSFTSDYRKIPYF